MNLKGPLSIRGGQFFNLKADQIPCQKKNERMAL